MSGGIYFDGKTNAIAELQYITDLGTLSNIVDFPISGGDKTTFTGNVGIGTSSPTQKLDVNGYIKQNNTYFFVSDTTTSFTAAQTYGDTELIDRGGNWSTTTKRFTAPVKGLYTFTFVGYTVTNEHYGLGYNSDNPDTGRYQTKSLWSIYGGTGGSHTWTLEMNASDYITLRLYNSGNLAANRCYFMGGLLYAV
jgi:hypothetical protein